MPNRQDHGWWAYWGPLMSFLVLGEIAGRFPESVQPAFLPLKVAVPGLLFAYFFFVRGAYPELRTYKPGVPWLLFDFAVGVLGGALWMAPYIAALQVDPPAWQVLPEFMQPDPSDGFDRAQLGESLVWLTLLLRFIGYAIVTPFAEEVFIRSWLMRFAEVFDREVDFRRIPMAHFTWRSFWIVVVFFTVSHVPWEWPVAVPWIVLTQLYFYWRKELGALVALHAGSNAGILLFVWITDGRLTGAGGRLLDLWFFV